MKSVTLVLFGGTGDLAKKKILPALYGLISRKIIDKINLISTGRGPLSSEEYAKTAGLKHNEHIRVKYLQADFENGDMARGLKQMLKDIEGENCIGRLFYFAISPKYFGTVAKELAELSEDGKKFNRLLFEKPFGHDLKSSEELNDALTKYFKEQDIFRVDHYLGKETVKNILSLRLGNPFFERTWNSEFIDSIRIIVSEDIGVGTRIDYYDDSGAIRDMVQNHMLQMLSLILMEPPESADAEDIHRQKVDALKGLYAGSVIVGQYDGYIKELKAQGKPESDTETYAHLELYSKSKRWNGTKISLMTGKNLDSKYARIELYYKKEPCMIYCDLKTVPNKLMINVQPKQDIDFYMNIPAPGSYQDMKNVKMNFCKECQFSENMPESYELILEECIRGEKTLFINSMELEYSWKLVDDIITRLPKPVIYPKGSRIFDIDKR